MTCPACGTRSLKSFWRCPDCGELNRLRVVKWVGAVLAPVFFLVLLFWGNQVAQMMGMHRGTMIWGWANLFFPFAGVPFLWLGEGGRVRKILLSLGYVILVCGVMLLPVFLWAIAWALRGGFCL